MSRKLKALVCVAHPDDETIFFAGLILSKKYDWTVVCVTDANADGKGKARMQQFKNACKVLRVKNALHFKYQDQFSRRIPVDKLQADLQELGKFDVVYTHGILGEYGHIQHQDVSFATHRAFHGRAPVFSVAYNVYPQMKIPLSARQFKMKTDILWKVYRGESMRFLNLLPATFHEGFVQVSLKEIESIYDFIRRRSKLKKSALKVYSWLVGYIQKRDFELKFRPF